MIVTEQILNNAFEIAKEEIVDIDDMDVEDLESFQRRFTNLVVLLIKDKQEEK